MGSENHRTGWLPGFLPVSVRLPGRRHSDRSWFCSESAGRRRRVGSENHRTGWLPGFLHPGTR
ncbi:hypothetical protein DXJ98_24240, partial [Salmonella enterica subsp. enterica]|nr:hypothetical protein [Salmonella enterica subsp. enterica]